MDRLTQLAQSVSTAALAADQVGTPITRIGAGPDITTQPGHGCFTTVGPGGWPYKDLQCLHVTLASQIREVDC